VVFASRQRQDVLLLSELTQRVSESHLNSTKSKMA
jgi:hypothetical protein